MAQTNVSSCVLSIVASFTSGLDVFKKFRETRRRKKRRHRKDASVDDEELRLARSLRQGPEEIGREYQKSMHGVGEGFAMGDVAAQTTLAEILLKLNTGLVTIINTFLTRDKGDVNLDYQSLTSLSERSRIDTCRTLRALYHRMVQCRLPAQVSAPQDDRENRSQATSKVSSSRKSRSVANPKHSKVRGPMLARVVIADSSKPSQVALVRPGERKKKPQSSSSSLSTSKAQSSASLLLPVSTRSNEPPSLPTRPANPRSQTMPAATAPRRKHSAMEMRNEQATRDRIAVQASRSTPRLSAPNIEHEPLPPMPHTAPLPAIEPRRRKPTPTFYSIETASTKLGEIPMHRWAEPYDFATAARLNREAETSGWPITDMQNPQLNKKRGLFRLFRRKAA